jgi:hypothetical protein
VEDRGGAGVTGLMQAHCHRQRTASGVEDSTGGLGEDRGMPATDLV